MDINSEILKKKTNSSGFSTMLRNPPKISIKKFKKRFFRKYISVLNPLFRDEIIFKIFLAAFCTRYYHLKKVLKTSLVPGTKYGIFR
jgi:hypothetical protein